MNAAPAVEVRQHILDTAMPIILGKGFSAVGLNEILATAGVPKGSFYHYFGSKEAFGEALLTLYFTEYAERLEEQLVQRGGSPVERLMGYFEEWRTMQCADGPDGKCLAVKLGAEVSDLSEPMRAVLRRGTEEIIRRIAVCIDEACNDGSLTGVSDASSTAATLYELWLGATLMEKIRRDRSPLDAAMTTTRQLLNLPRAA
ncbi:TetR family transcriptional regulator [Paraburkholderia eburnea]|uniref:TetR family transcriptional regulator n=1 Tax=Paraburkholderia eburnea TaxID=1189126 RepID=A0A2S4MBT0_9BURK|nr:TetR/AcrR family transcriptional regulator [Paraburkholderia eburnea]POR52193.1 TetR family transcriptional regulator [Paraburkholderia eburnea]PRZ23084.1 TetR family transcriptional regulator [Paraburkholderia eburnea]